MPATVLEALEEGALAAGLRASLWAYPLVNAGHILGIALLVGGVLPLTLRLLGLWKRIPLRPFADILGATAGAGLALAVSCGFLLFTARAVSYAASPIFRAKIILIALGILVSLVLLYYVRGEDAGGGAKGTVRLARPALAAATLLLWVAVLVLGRLIAYF